jgi:UDP-N-acetylglucosamine 1-carboxyvinyltransferase
MGAEIIQQNGRLVCRAPRLHGTTIYLDYPSVGATENLMMAATLAVGETVIHHAAKEPEIVDLACFLNAMGAKIKGGGTDTIVIQGVQKLSTTSYKVIPDRIVAGTMMIAGAMTNGEVLLENVIPDHVRILIDLLQQAGCHIEEGENTLFVKGTGRPKAIKKVTTSPFPGFPTDLQAQLMAFLSIAEGVSIVKETVFDARFRHVNELNRMGASIYVDLNTAFIRGVEQLTGAVVEASDLRAGAALVLAGLVADGQTRVQQIHHIDRGYENLEQALRQLGANISRKTVE